MDENTLCDVCGDDMHDQNFDEMKVGIRTMIGVVLTVEPTPNSRGDHPEQIKFYRTFGKTKLQVCMTCWAKSLGVKPVQ